MFALVAVGAGAIPLQIVIWLGLLLQPSYNLYKCNSVALAEMGAAKLTVMEDRKEKDQHVNEETLKTKSRCDLFVEDMNLGTVA